MPKHFVTFGTSHNHEINDKQVGFRTVARFDANTAREGRQKAFDTFGNKFCFEYHEDAWDKKNMIYFPDGYVDLDI